MLAIKLLAVKARAEISPLLGRYTACASFRQETIKFVDSMEKLSKIPGKMTFCGFIVTPRGEL